MGREDYYLSRCGLGWGLPLREGIRRRVEVYDVDTGLFLPFPAKATKTGSLVTLFYALLPGRTPGYTHTVQVVIVAVPATRILITQGGLQPYHFDPPNSSTGNHRHFTSHLSRPFHTPNTNSTSHRFSITMPNPAIIAIVLAFAAAVLLLFGESGYIVCADPSLHLTPSVGAGQLFGRHG